MLLLLVGLLAAVAVRPPRPPGEWLPGAGPLVLLAGVLGASALAALVVAVRPSPGRVMATLATAVAAAWLVLAAFFLPAFVSAQPNRDIVADVLREQRYRPDLRLVTCSDPARARRIARQQRPWTAAS